MTDASRLYCASLQRGPFDDGLSGESLVYATSIPIVLSGWSHKLSVQRPQPETAMPVDEAILQEQLTQ
ncbi:MAG TPA: hypothetical protein VF021_06280, partial [Longimicrobiales bacterium]